MIYINTHTYILGEPRVGHVGREAAGVAELGRRRRQGLGEYML